MNYIKEILEGIQFELLVNVEFWNVIILWIMLYCSLRIALDFERKENLIMFLDNILIFFFKIQISIFLLQLFRIMIIFKYDFNLLEYLYLSAIFFCIYMVWLFFTCIVYNEIKRQRNNLRVKLLEFWIILILALMLLYNIIVFLIKVYFI